MNDPTKPGGNFDLAVVRSGMPMATKPLVIG